MIATSALETPGPPRTAVIAIARMIDGKASTTSAARMMMLSSHPPT